MPPDTRVNIGVAACVVRNFRDPQYLSTRKQLLMIKRVGNTGFAADGYDTWSMPGGWIDHGETPYQTAVREVLEETGLHVQPYSLNPQLGWVMCPSQVHDISIITLFIKCLYQGGEPVETEPDKCAEPQWVDLATLRNGERKLFAPLQAWLDQKGDRGL